MPGLRRLYAPQRVGVRTDPGGAPMTVEGTTVETVREEWLVEDRWWTPKPLRRHYFELALCDGRALTVFRTARAQRWYRQRA
jgi:hypothetical protein